MSEKRKTRNKAKESETSTTQPERSRKERFTNNTEESTDGENTSKTACPECNGNVTEDKRHGERRCQDCGLVIDEEEIDHGPEWRAFDSKERNQKSRVGAPSSKLIHDDGLATNIDWRDKDGYGNSLSSKKRARMDRLRKRNSRSKASDSSDRNLKEALSEITRMGAALGLPDDVQEISSMLYRGCMKEDLIPGRSIEGMATACLYASARMEDIPRSLKEMARVSRVNKRRIARAYSYINRELGLEIGPADPKQYIDRFASNIDCVSHETKQLSRELIEHIKQEEIHSGKSPTGIAAATLYMAGKLCNDEPTQKDIAEVSGVTEVTIRERYQDIVEHGSESWIHGSYNV